MSEAKSIWDYMIRQPVCAELWQPLSFVRQIMLVNSFSYLPVRDRDGSWRLLSDTSLARFTRGHSKNERFNRLRMSLSEAIAMRDGLELNEAPILKPDTPIQKALATCDGLPILIAEDPNGPLLGLATPFDLL